ncbi:MAG: gfo/Idh/MocA family oxidoreductase, partial [Verrucomicrobiota bacterium]
TADFAYAGPLTETILLGDIAARFPQTTLEWHSRKMKFNLSEANQYVRREYRKGWEVKGL